MSEWSDLKHAWVRGGSNYESRWYPNVSTSAVGHDRVARAFAARLVMFLLPPVLLLLLLLLLQWFGWRQLSGVDACYFSSARRGTLRVRNLSGNCRFAGRDID